MKVTLKQLRAHKACFSGYNKVVRALQSLPFTDKDAERNTYIRFKHVDPIPLEAIRASNGFDDALWATKCLVGHDRDLRLFAVWCVRQVQPLLEDERSMKVLDVAEAFANGLATQEELDAARDAAASAAYDAYDAYDAAYDATTYNASYATTYNASYAAYATTYNASYAASASASASASTASASTASAAALGDREAMFIKMCRGEAPWQQ